MVQEGPVVLYPKVPTVRHPGCYAPSQHVASRMLSSLHGVSGSGVLCANPASTPASHVIPNIGQKSNISDVNGEERYPGISDVSNA